MTIAAIEWLRDSAIDRGLHNYAQWIDEHMHAAIAAVEGEFMPQEVASLKVQIAELSDQLSAEKARAADLEQAAEDYKATATANTARMAAELAAEKQRSADLMNQMAPAGAAPAVEPVPAAKEPSPGTAGTLFPTATEQKDTTNG